MKWQAIKSFVTWKPNDSKRLTPSEKGLISKYFGKIGRLKAQGYTYSNRLKPATVRKINRKQQFKAPLLKGAWIKCPPGAKPYFSPDGESTGWTRGGITRVEVQAQFYFDDEIIIEDDDDPDANGDSENRTVTMEEVREEAARVTAALQLALKGKKLSRVAIAYAGGDGDTQSPPVTASLLIIETRNYGAGNYKPMNGIAGFYFARSKNIAKQIDKVKKATAERNKKRRAKRKGNI